MPHIPFCKPLAVLAGIAALTAIGGQASAQTLLDQYTARLSDQDHYNSNGKRLDTPAQIIRQDRANFHKFGRRDADDTTDQYFSSAKNREWLENMLSGSKPPAAVMDEILNGAPLVQVTIYEGKVQVTLMDGAGGQQGGGQQGGQQGGDGGDQFRPGTMPTFGTEEGQGGGLTLEK
ncbi:hypothetical protein ACKTEK_10285 [Tepidamorphus sp. 3E244]|uniref:hypothetical protein n=1 Tax=Tepidamorphus sp. 3E244 TaxID=3385498 RepID=UPI0038FC7E60